MRPTPAPQSKEAKEKLTPEQAAAALEAIVTALQSADARQRVLSAFKSSGTKKRDESLEELATQYVECAVRQVSEKDTEAHLELLRCPPGTFVKSLESFAVKSVPPNHLTGEGYFIPKWNKALVCMTPVAVVGVRGYEGVVMRNGGKDIKAAAIREQDKFEHVQGTQEILAHTPNLRADPKKPNPIIGAWAIVEMKDGRKHTLVVPIAENDLNSYRMDKESQAKYRAQRAVSRHVLRTYCMDNAAVRALVEAERNQEELGAQDPSLATKTTTAERPSTIANATPVAGLTPTENADDTKAMSETMPAAATAAPSAPAPVAPAPVVAEAPSEKEIPAEDLQSVVEALAVKSGEKSNSPGTPLSRVSDGTFEKLLKWAKTAKAIPPSEKAFADAALAVEKICEKHGIGFAQIKEKVAAKQAQSEPAGVRI